MNEDLRGTPSRDSSDDGDVRRPRSSAGTGETPRAESWRADVDGLRAVALLAVVVFHLRREWLPGGFAGVD
ncbi:MAG: hypothetical protein ACKOCT_14105, partial [Alphaproteobacteria bacterium]